MHTNACHHFLLHFHHMAATLVLLNSLPEDIFHERPTSSEPKSNIVHKKRENLEAFRLCFLPSHSGLLRARNNSLGAHRRAFGQFRDTKRSLWNEIQGHIAVVE